MDMAVTKPTMKEIGSDVDQIDGFRSSGAIPPASPACTTSGAADRPEQMVELAAPNHRHLSARPVNLRYAGESLSLLV